MDSIFAWAPTGALVSLGGNGNYLHWGFIQISVANFVLICLMVAVFAAALVVPFRRRHRSAEKVGTGLEHMTDRPGSTESRP